MRKSILFVFFTLFLIGNVYSQEAGSILARLRVISVIPVESSEISVIGGEADATTAYIPELDFTYFFSPNLALELILGTSKHTITAIGTDLGDVPLGDVWLLPPTLTLHYFLAPGGVINPYIGVGLNFTLFYNAGFDGTPVTAISYGKSFGPAVRAGFDVKLNDKLSFNIDVKKIRLNTDVELSAAGARIQADVDLNPWVIGAGAGFKLN